MRGGKFTPLHSSGSIVWACTWTLGIIVANYVADMAIASIDSRATRHKAIEGRHQGLGMYEGYVSPCSPGKGEEGTNSA